MTKERPSPKTQTLSCDQPPRPITRRGLATWVGPPFPRTPNAPAVTAPVPLDHDEDRRRFGRAARPTLQLDGVPRPRFHPRPRFPDRRRTGTRLPPDNPLSAAGSPHHRSVPPPCPRRPLIDPHQPSSTTGRPRSRQGCDDVLPLRGSPSQGRCREFESRHPLQVPRRSERDTLPHVDVASSSLVIRSDPEGPAERRAFVVLLVGYGGVFEVPAPGPRLPLRCGPCCAESSSSP